MLLTKFGWRQRCFTARIRPVPGSSVRKSWLARQNCTRAYPVEQGVQAHISGHCVATTKPSPNRHRMLHRNPDKSYRLFREGDPYHPGRQDGKTRPDREALPETYRYLVDWYESEYSPHRPRTLEEDPLMRLKGLGKDVWRSLGGGDAVIRWLRSDEIIPPPWEQTTENNANRKTAVPSRSAGTSVVHHK